MDLLFYVYVKLAHFISNEILSSSNTNPLIKMKFPPLYN